MERSTERVFIRYASHLDAHMMPLRNRISDVDGRAHAALQRRNGAPPQNGKRLRLGGCFGCSDGAIDQDIEMSA